MKKIILILLLLPNLVQAQNAIVGKWKVTQFDIIVDGKHLEELEQGRTKLDTLIYFEFNKDNSFIAPAWLNPVSGSLKKNSSKGKYSIVDNVLRLDFKDEFDSSLQKIFYNFEIKDDILKLSFDKPTLIKSLKGSKNQTDKIILNFVGYFKTLDAFMITQKQP